jgi:hypothetical protein
MRPKLERMDPALAPYVDRVYHTQTMDSVCDMCERIASWRVVNRETGVPVYAACVEHRPVVRAAFLENC